MNSVTLKKEISVLETYDVAVCGGGPSGIIAAIAAARGGARVCLIEKYGFLGGAATAALVDPISVFKSNGAQVIGGIPWEFVERLSQEGGAISDYENGNVPIDAEKYKLIAQRMILEAGVDLYLHSYLSDVILENHCISHIVISNKSGMRAIACQYIIDCTGDADACYLAGVPKQENLPIGKYGQMRLEYMKKHRRGTLTTMVTEARLNLHLYEIDQAANKLISESMSRQATSLGVTEQMKADDPMGWV